jgi:hypothetical protein
VRLLTHLELNFSLPSMQPNCCESVSNSRPADQFREGGSTVVRRVSSRVERRRKPDHRERIRGSDARDVLQYVHFAH